MPIPGVSKDKVRVCTECAKHLTTEPSRQGCVLRSILNLTTEGAAMTITCSTDFRLSLSYAQNLSMGICVHLHNANKLAHSETEQLLVGTRMFASVTLLKSLLW